MPLPIPEPLRAAEIGTFTHYSVVKRLPNIGRQIITDNDFSPATNAALETLIDEIPEGPIRLITDIEAPDSAVWNTYIKAYQEQNWLDPPWFSVETYFYRRVIEATSYYIVGHPHFQQDPFAGKKEDGLKLGRKQIHEVIKWIDELFTVKRVSPQQALHRMLAVALWGNQADLSLWPAGEGNQPQHNDENQAQAHLLADDSAQVVSYLKDVKEGRVDMVLDNAGFELIGDLCLTDFLLYSGYAKVVYWHLKIHPTFVSDATIQDVHKTVDWLLADSVPILKDIGRRLKIYLEKGWWQLVDHPFWTSPLPMWEMTAELQSELAFSDLIITKGDANYRRLLGDRHWPFTSPFSGIVSYAPAPLLALRTLKSEVAAGLTAETIKATTDKDPEWLTDGRWGLMQFVK
jgi:uncharacterized protein with ATP-grasp and redox domains